MKLESTLIAGLYVAHSDPYEDERGSFTRIYCRETLNAAGLSDHVPVQINYSITNMRGSLRGMHYQTEKNLEGKVVRCLKGRVLDVVVDIRHGSPTFMKHYSIELDSPSVAMIIPSGCAHGFQVLSERCEILYLNSTEYTPEHQGGLLYDDPRLGIQWPLPITNISDRDRSFSLITDDFEGIKNAV